MDVNTARQENVLPTPLTLIQIDATLQGEQKLYLEQLRHNAQELNGDIQLFEEEVKLLQREISKDAKMQKLKKLQRIVRIMKNARDANTEEYNAVRRFLLGEFLPSKTLFEKIELMNRQLEEVQQEECLIAGSKLLSAGR